jgi:p70 ribosomal S6 kinase
MDIPAGADADELARAPLVGPSVLPTVPAAAACEADSALDAEEAEPRKLGPSDFTILSLVGQGAFGKVRAPRPPALGAAPEKCAQVFQVQKRDDGRVLAMKVMRKAHVVEKNQAEYMRTERDVLTRVEHPYIVLLHYSFQVCPLRFACVTAADAPATTPGAWAADGHEAVSHHGLRERRPPLLPALPSWAV